jgi:peptidoglycan hydrolase-like protein with peptidoglycan-binding domain
MEVADPACGEWDVRLEERVRRKPARVVQANRLATMSNVDTVGAYSRLRRLPADTVLFRGMPYEHIQAELNRLGAQRPNDLAVLMYRATLATGTVTPDHLAGIVQQVDLALGRRYGATRLLLQAHDDEAMFVRAPTARARTRQSSTRHAGSSVTPASGWGPTFRRSSWLFPRGCGRRPRSGPAVS